MLLLDTKKEATASDWTGAGDTVGVTLGTGEGAVDGAADGDLVGDMFVVTIPVVATVMPCA